jgi:thiol-disulfide isomerase/thioredoxin
MNQKIKILTLLGISMFACNFLFPQVSATPDVQPSTTETPIVNLESATQTPQNSTSVPETSTAEILVDYDDFKVVRLHPSDGNLQTLLPIEAKQATSLGLMPIVEFDATWCPPCIAIDEAIQEQNELMLNAYRGTYIIKVDVDEWGWKDGVVQNFNFEFIPIYFKIDANGEQTGQEIDGGAWNEDIPENIAPVMDEFFHNN